MSKGSKKSAKTKAAMSTQTAKRHTSVPAAPAAAVIERPAVAVIERTAAEAIEQPETVVESAAAEPVITAVVTPIEVVAVEEATTISEPSTTATAIAPVEATPTPAVDAQIVAGLIGDLRNDDADIAREAAIALGTSGSSIAVDALIEVLENTSGYYHSVVRSAAAASLAKLGDKRAVASLLGAVNDTMAEASAEAVRALADLGDSRAVDTLVGVVQNVTGFYQPVVRLAAVHALGTFGGPQAAAERAHVAADPNEDAVIRDAAGE